MIDKYWEIVENNLSFFQQQLFTYCARKGILFKNDDFHQALLQVAEGIIKGYWNREMNIRNINNYLFITFRNINYLKLKEMNTDNLEDIIYDDITILDTIPIDEEEYQESDYISIDAVFSFIINTFGEDKSEEFKNKLLHKRSAISSSEYISILMCVRQHFYPNRDNWYGDYEKCLESKKKLKQWKLNHPNATKEEYDSFYRELNNSRIKEYLKDWRENNQEKIKENNDKYREYHRDYSKIRWRNRNKNNDDILQCKL